MKFNLNEAKNTIRLEQLSSHFSVIFATARTHG